MTDKKQLFTEFSEAIGKAIKIAHRIVNDDSIKIASVGIEYNISNAYTTDERLLRAMCDKARSVAEIEYLEEM